MKERVLDIASERFGPKSKNIGYLIGPQQPTLVDVFFFAKISTANFPSLVPSTIFSRSLRNVWEDCLVLLQTQKLGSHIETDVKSWYSSIPKRPLNRASHNVQDLRLRRSQLRLSHFNFGDSKRFTKLREAFMHGL